MNQVAGANGRTRLINENRQRNSAREERREIF